jgi:hypothetical protein
VFVFDASVLVLDVLVFDVSVLVLDVLVFDVSVLVFDVLVFDVLALDSTLESSKIKNPVSELIAHETDDNPSAPTAIIGNELLLLI